MADEQGSPAQPSWAPEPFPVYASEVPVAGSDKDPLWSADEQPGPADAAFGSVNYVCGPVTVGAAEPDQAEHSMMQVRSSQGHSQDTELVTLQHAAPASKTAQSKNQGEASRGAQHGAAQKASQLVAEPRQQLPPEELPGQHTPILHQAAGAAAVVAASTAGPVLEPAVHPQDASQEEGAQPFSSSIPLYTCHLQGLGNASLALLGQEDAFSAGEHLLFNMNWEIITMTSGVINADSETHSTPAMRAVSAESSPWHAAGFASAGMLTVPCREELDLALAQYYEWPAACVAVCLSGMYREC